MSPWARVASSLASSTWIVAPSGRTTRGPDAGAGGGEGAVCCGELHAARSSAIVIRLFFTFHLHDVARDEIVLLRVVAERAKRHPQQFRGLRLHASAALERLQHEDLSDGLQVILKRDSLVRKIERRYIWNGAAEEHVLGKRRSIFRTRESRFRIT